MFFQKARSTSKLFSAKEIAELWQTMNKKFKNSKYGVGSVVTYCNNEKYRKLVYSPKERKFLIPDYEKVVENYYTCGQYARSSFKFFKESKFEFIKSCAFVYGSDDKFPGHCILVLSKTDDTHLQMVSNVIYEVPPDPMKSYLQENCLIFDPCRKQIFDYRDSNFKAKYFLPKDLQCKAKVDEIVIADNRTLVFLGDTQGFSWGFNADAEGKPYIAFSSRNEHFQIYSYDDYHAQRIKFRKLLESSEVQGTLNMFFNMEITNSISSFVSEQTLIY